MSLEPEGARRGRDSGLAPIDPPRAGTLILGSFPSRLSLEAGQYYGNPRNHFWFLVGAVLGREAPEAYADRLALLHEAGIALWDLVATCEREGSLDADIRAPLLNPIPDFVAERPRVLRLGLNGGAAAGLFSRLVGDGRFARAAIGEALAWTPAAAAGRSLLVVRLPSSSPVPSAGFRRAEDKLPFWRAFLEPAPLPPA